MDINFLLVERGARRWIVGVYLARNVWSAFVFLLFSALFRMTAWVSPPLPNARIASDSFASSFNSLSGN